MACNHEPVHRHNNRDDNKSAPPLALLEDDVLGAEVLAHEGHAHHGAGQRLILRRGGGWEGGRREDGWLVAGENEGRKYTNKLGARGQEVENATPLQRPRWSGSYLHVLDSLGCGAPLALCLKGGMEDGKVHGKNRPCQ